MPTVNFFWKFFFSIASKPKSYTMPPKMYKCYVIGLKLVTIGFCKTFLLTLCLELEGFVWNSESARKGRKKLRKMIFSCSILL